jgi:UDP-3-O-[3-hydroxymyristoyl] glucosamine N-acyltransferase
VAVKAIELPTTAADLAALFGADISGDPHASVSRLSSLAHAGHGALSFFSDLKYGEDLRKAAGAVVFSRAENVRAGCGITFLGIELV